MASKVSSAEYNLLLQNDVNTQGHTQWFFFKVANTTKSLRVKFNILNLVKGASLYNQGMQVAVYSQSSFESEGRGWFRGGDEISYFPNSYRRDHVASKTFYTMTFSYTFPEDRDVVYFAYSVPYTYTQLNEYLKALEDDPARCLYVTRKTLCRTIAGNKCEYLTITNPGTVQEVEARRGIVVSGRVHPGETVGSWMIHGLIDFLTSAAPEAHQLRNTFCVKVVPMLNPDGVVNGNHRTNLSGADLNRRWKYPSKQLHPTIYAMKRMIKGFAAKTPLEIICDFHGHSRKKNIFIFGCNSAKEPEACKLFPYILSKINPSFNFKDCRFGIQRAKEATLRVSLFKELRLPKVYTLEASFAGADCGPQAHTHFTTGQLEEMGKDFLLAVLVDCSYKAPRGPRFDDFLRSSASSFTASSGVLGLDVDSLRAELLQNEDLLRAGEEACSSDDSDSEPSEDNLDTTKLNKLIPKESRVKARSLPRTTAKTRTSLKPNTSMSVKRCPDCGDPLFKRHNCKPPQPPPPAPSQPMLRKPVGVKTYYNRHGKMVHDQATQTPVSLYPKHSLKNRRADSLSRALSIEAGSQAFQRLRSTNPSAESSVDFKDPEGFISALALFKPTQSEKWRVPVMSTRTSAHPSPNKRGLPSRYKQGSIFNSPKQVSRNINSQIAARQARDLV